MHGITFKSECYFVVKSGHRWEEGNKKEKIRDEIEKKEKGLGASQ